MGRYLWGVASALLLMTAGFLLWRAQAGQEIMPPPPDPAPVTRAGEPDEPLPPPQATERTREERRFDRYDRDRDDSITREEYLRTRRTAFAKLDVNGDGRLSFDEWAIRTTTKFAGADADRSGALGREEFATTRVVRRTPARCNCPEPADD